MTGPVEQLVVEEHQVLSIHELEVRADRLHRLEQLARDRGHISLAEALAATPRIEELRRDIRGEMATIPDCPATQRNTELPDDPHEAES